MRVHREGSGEPWVLIHGCGASLGCWAPVLPALAVRHEVLAVDLPGFGDTPPLPAGVPSTVPALVDAVEGQFDALGLKSVHVAGNSMGGWIALELARRGRARSVVAIAPAGLAGGEPAVPADSAFGAGVGPRLGPRSPGRSAGSRARPTTRSARSATSAATAAPGSTSAPRSRSSTTASCRSGSATPSGRPAATTGTAPRAARTPTTGRATPSSTAEAPSF